jgi:hypothetical protein
MEPIIPQKTRGLSIFGIFLILFGAGLILSKLHLFHYRWGVVLWVCLGVAGLMAVIQAFITKRRGQIFWGSLLFFSSIAMLVHRYALIDTAPWDVPATFSLAIGLSFLMLFFFDPRRFGVIIPILFFGGYGVLYYLWWWDVIDWFDLKYYLHTYWPVLVIVWGLSLIFRPRK